MAGMPNTAWLILCQSSDENHWYIMDGFTNKPECSRELRRLRREDKQYELGCKYRVEPFNRVRDN